jgi:hypothetical protein
LYEEKIDHIDKTLIKQNSLPPRETSKSARPPSPISTR